MLSDSCYQTKTSLLSQTWGIGDSWELRVSKEISEPLEDGNLELPQEFYGY